MGSSPRAHLAYGYDLGSDEDPRFAEKDKYGEITLPWFDAENEDDDEGERGFVEQLFNHLYSLISDPPAADYDFRRQTIAEEHFGIEMAYAGSSEYSPGHILIAKGSRSSVTWSETMPLDFASLGNDPLRHGWYDQINVVVRALGITPTQDGPKWLVYPNYG